MFCLRQNAGFFIPPGGIQKMGEMMEQLKRNKGGRPRKEIRRDQQLAVMCTQEERRTIEEKAKAVNLSLSQFLRMTALGKQIVTRQKSLPPEILQFTATLNHLAANINQLAKKSNRMEDLSAAEQVHADNLIREIKDLAVDIKSYLK